jgi:hypothetical protein
MLRAIRLAVALLLCMRTKEANFPALDIFSIDYISAAMPRRLIIRLGFLAFAILSAVVVLAATANAAELVMFRRDGCPWCAKWDREIGPIYPKTEFNSRAPLRQVNLDHDPDPPIAHARIIYTPTFVLAEDGKEVGRIEGYPGDEFFWVRLENLLQQSPRAAPKEPTPDMSPPAGASVVSPERVR